MNAGRVALVAEVCGGSTEVRSALASCGVTPVMLGSAAESEICERSRDADLVLVDIDFGGRGLGLRLVETAQLRSDASVILIGADLESAPADAAHDRCHFLQRPVHAGQLRTTIRLALAQRARRSGCHPALEKRRHQLEAALHQIKSVVRTLSALPQESAGTTTSLDELRPRERQIIDLLLAHQRVPAIAAALDISAHTVRNHLKNIYRRTGLHSQQELLSELKRGAR